MSFEVESVAGRLPEPALPSSSDGVLPNDRSGAEPASGAAQAFWQQELADALPLLDFPTDRPRQARVVRECAQVEIDLDGARWQQLNDAARALGAAVDEIVRAAYQVFLARYAGQQDVLIGVDDDRCGTVVLRQPMAPSLTLRELLRHNRQRLAAAAVFGPLAGVGLALLRERSGEPGHAALYQHAFKRVTSASIGALDTLLVLGDGGPSPRLALQYNKTLFEAESAERWARNLATLLTSAAAAPDAATGTLALLHAREQAFIAASLDRTCGPYRPRWPNVHTGFEQQAAKTPHAPAVRRGTTTLTYAELDGRANAIALALREHGVQPGDLVGICCARNTDMVAAVIGVLKLGAAYVPMDIKYPLRRLQAIAEQARLAHVLCDGRGAGLAGATVQELRLEGIAASAPAFQQPVVDGDALSHVIFTSGSTGEPKGVMARHRNSLAFIDWIHRHYSAEELRVTLCCSSLCFDLTVFELWGPLLVGGQVVVVDNAAELVRRPEDGLTLVNTVPTALRLLLDEQALPASVQTVNVCGEPLDAQLVNDLFRAHPGVVFYNTYGPTEDTAYSTFFRMDGPVDDDPPIGEPLVHEFGRVVDAQGMPVPVGAVGELCIGGAGVARGYVNKPEQTAERFVASTGYDGTPAMVYRSGDYVRLRNDGLLHFVGRRDDQVKVRGFRIDLGDVVSALQQVNGVLDARVLVRRHSGGDMLVAYVSHADMPAGLRTNPALQRAIEAETRSRVPAFMVPSRFVLFDKLPLNENGKVDRQALAALPLDAEPASAGATAPDAALDDRQLTLLEIWRTVLGPAQIGVHDDFFALGGNSLSAVRMTSRLNKAFGLNLPSQAVFEDRSIAALAKRLQGEAADPAVLLQKVDLSAGVAPTFPQRAMLMDPAKTAFNMCSAIRIDGPLDQAALRLALQQLVQRHDALRARFVVNGMDARMHFVAEAADPLRVVDLGSTAPQDLQSAVQAELDHEWRAPFDLAAGPLLRALLLRGGDELHWLVVSVHHVVSDEWSVNLLKKDLARLYAAQLDRAPAPAPLCIGYGDYAAWQARLFGGELFGRQLRYWAAELADVKPQAPFPLAGGQPPRQALRAHVQWAAPAGLAGRLASLAARQGSTAFVVFVAALQLALAQHSGLAQQLLWTPVSRRAQPELEDLVGLFTNLAAIGARAEPDLRLFEFLALIERKVAAARANSDVSALTAAMHDPALLPPLPMIGLNLIELPDEGPWQLEGAQTRALSFELCDETDLCALELTIRRNAQGLGFVLSHNTADFTAQAVRLIGANFWAAIEQFDRHPERRIAELVPPPDHVRPEALLDAAD